ncbi:hypothetical protein [Colwellia psychrerythraea]|uniref:Uncharacterized protein n=1 Tax=Colwellia psychrerythraea TaxID=28229 RepID=A0A099KTV3_COLPS|nr:hypothetical protein [Colwellia psychrerythraea]KGJ93595.1 hypothetical protein ND2E_2324 [Colwellia psychrerythraea]
MFNQNELKEIFDQVIHQLNDVDDDARYELTKTLYFNLQNIHDLTSHIINRPYPNKVPIIDVCRECGQRLKPNKHS